MKSRIVLTIIIIFSYLPLSAQKNNIEIGLGGYNFLNVIGQLDNLINSINIKYGRSINNNIGIYAQYTRAPING